MYRAYTFNMKSDICFVNVKIPLNIILSEINIEYRVEKGIVSYFLKNMLPAFFVEISMPIIHK